MSARTRSLSVAKVPNRNLLLQLLAATSPLAALWVRPSRTSAGHHSFPRAAAVVTDVGAPLSHAAIVARELGIPAVVGCGNATALLHTGDRVRVDGPAGVVQLLSGGQ
jgi:phosphohistidine swiveling domain-containing protein